MSEQDDFTRVFVWVLGLLVLFTIVVILIARSIGLDENSGSMADKDVDKRTMPYGGVKIAGEAEKAMAKPETPEQQAPMAAPEEAKSATETAPAKPVATIAAAAPAIDGKALYAACAGCHDNRIAGAPKPGDAAAWAPRLTAGVDSLTTNAIKGKGAMPPKGGRMDYSDAQIRAIVEYMTSK